MSLDLELQRDLHEAFQLLYDGEPDDFDFDQEDGEEGEPDEIVDELPAGNGREVVKGRPIDFNKISKVSNFMAGTIWAYGLIAMR
jgi:hypothetical protein